MTQHYKLTWPQIAIFAVALAAAFLGGVGAGAAIVGGNLPGEITFALVGLIGTVIAALGGIVKIGYDRISRALADNTATTERALVAASAAADSTNWQQQATALRARAELAERKVSLIAGLPSCGPCRAEIDRILAEGRVLRRADDPPGLSTGPADAGQV